MSIKVKDFDDDLLRESIQQCPMIVQQYIEKLKKRLDIQIQLTQEAINKLRKL